MKLSGKAAFVFVTGSASGIGRTVALRLAQNHAQQ
ncbi:hypothetical protein CTP10_R55460 [Cupriavidus sp. P-10]|nr:hypothetical protein CTP10_R55460 [Cupriavidus sp. P-10]